MDGPLLDLAASCSAGPAPRLGESADHLEAIRLIESSRGGNPWLIRRLPRLSRPLTFRAYAVTSTMSDWGSTNRLPAHVALVEGVVLDGDLHLLTRPAYPSRAAPRPRWRCSTAPTPSSR